jgi:hypothetical protein
MYGRSHVDNAAYVFLALGAQANQMNCPAAIETLVRYGGWDGDVISTLSHQQLILIMRYS